MRQSLRPRRQQPRRAAGVAALSATLLLAAVVALPAAAAGQGFPRTYKAETDPGFTNTFSTNDVLSPACPQALAATPGSEPASKVLNTALNTGGNFEAGGTVHFIYSDNPHTNAGTQNFTIQDCVVTYPAGFFSAGDFDPLTGVLTNPTFSKSRLSSGGTQIDGASLSGIDHSVGSIYYGWTAPASMAANTWVCFFARDIRNNHGGGGNRKVPPTCYQIRTPEPPPIPKQVTTPDIYLGYADTLHTTNAQFVPHPWLGDPNVTFLGCRTLLACGQEYDAGVIRVDNPPSNDALTLTGASVLIRPVASADPAAACQFHPWDALIGAGASVVSGGSIVLTQTGTAGPPQATPCDGRVALGDRPFTNFDTSEGPLDTALPAFSNCNPDLIAAPVITLTFSSGMTLIVKDAAKVLNTGGTDRYACRGQDEAGPYVQVDPLTIVRS